MRQRVGGDSSYHRLSTHVPPGNVVPPEGAEAIPTSYAYVLAAVLRRGGMNAASREDRLACAFVELRERIKEDFSKVAKDWEISTQELRRRFWHVYPVANDEVPDMLSVEQACEGVMHDLRCNIQTYAEQYYVPDDLLEAMLVDWLVSDRMGSDRTPPRYFVPEASVEESVSEK